MRSMGPQIQPHLTYVYQRDKRTEDDSKFPLLQNGRKLVNERFPGASRHRHKHIVDPCSHKQFHFKILS